jgi:hypothetical protein
MAIRTKKISELGKLSVTEDKIKTAGSLYVIGSEQEVTGKVDISEIYDVIVNYVSQCLAALQPTQPTATVSEESEGLATVKANVATLTKQISDLSKKYSNFVSSDGVMLDEMNTKIVALEEKCAKYEQFITSLQKDGYLTLKEIQRAAADACPICNHTHEETAE